MQNDGVYASRLELFHSLQPTFAPLVGVLGDEDFVELCRFLAAHLLFQTPRPAQLNSYGTVMSLMLSNSEGGGLSSLG